MGKKVVLLPLTRKNDRTKGQLFTTVSGKRLLKEREQDILGVIIVDKLNREQTEDVKPKLQ